MATRATITVADEADSFDIYQHHDGYPEGPFGLVRHITMARRLAWDIPRFEAADFAAAVVAVLKDRGGSTYLTEDAEAHSDRSYHYLIEPIREAFSTRVQLTIYQSRFDKDRSLKQVFQGDIQAAVQKFEAVAERSHEPRELEMLGYIDASLSRAEEEISQLCGGKPDEDTVKVFEDSADASRMMMTLQHHLEKSNPWAALDQAVKDKDSVSAKLAIEAHQRFQRE